MSLLSQVRTSAAVLPSRTFLYAREKWGKSSLFANAPGAVFFMTRGETGLVELIGGGRVPATAHFPYHEADPPSWATLRQAVRELIHEEHKYRLLVIDTANGAEILCQEHVRNTQFQRSVAKFGSYGKGWEACRVEWLGLLQDLDQLRATRKVGVVLLAHTQVKKFDDPTQDEAYDKYRPACQDKLWDLTHKWADIICFGHFETETYETDGGKVKAKAGLRRVLCFDQSPIWEAGNRYGIAGKLDVSRGAADGFKAFAAAVQKARSATPAGQPTQPVANAATATPPAASASPSTGSMSPGQPPAAESTPAHGAAARTPGDRAKELLALCSACGMTWEQAYEAFAGHVCEQGNPEMLTKTDDNEPPKPTHLNAEEYAEMPDFLRAVKRQQSPAAVA